MTEGQAAAIQKTNGFNENRTRELLSDILKFNFKCLSFRNFSVHWVNSRCQVELQLIVLFLSSPK